MSTAKTRPPGRWRPGESGNLRGRPPGTGKIAAFRDEIGKDLTTIVKAVVDKAKEGDLAAARLVLERTVPALRPIEVPVSIAMPDGTLAAKGHAVLAAAADASIPPGPAAQLLTALSLVAKLVESTELVQRIEALEKRHGMNSKK